MMRRIVRRFSHQTSDGNYKPLRKAHPSLLNSTGLHCAVRRNGPRRVIARLLPHLYFCLLCISVPTNYRLPEVMAMLPAIMTGLKLMK